MYNITDFILIYLRKSRSDNPDMSVEEVLAKHEAILQEYARNTYGCEIPEKNIYREVVSGETIVDRPMMRQILGLIESPSIQSVLVVEPQRLSRGDLEDCGRIVNVFRYTSTSVLTPTKEYDLANEYDRKFFEMELTRGNDYLEYTKRILNRGKISSVKRGNFIASVPPYGYNKITVGSGKDQYHTLVINEEEADTIKLMYDLFVNKGYGFNRIAHHLDSLGIKPRKSKYWSPSAIKDMVENPVYIGKIRWNWRKTNKIMENGELKKTRPKTKDEEKWIYVEGKHESIISEDIFQAALERRGKNPRIKKGSELKNPFAGLLYCGTCGHTMQFKTFAEKRNHDKISSSMLCLNQVHCHTKSVKYVDFCNRVIDSLENVIADFQIRLECERSDANKTNLNIIKNIEAELMRLHKKDLRQKDALDDGIYTKEEYLSRNLQVQNEIIEKEASLALVRSAITPIVDYKEKILQFQECIRLIQSNTVSPADKNMFLKSCIDKIVYYNSMESKPGIGKHVQNVFEIEVFLK